MSSTQPSTLQISDPQIVIVAPGDSPAAQANARGHLFEALIARLFAAYGCEVPTTQTLNVKSNGYELDIVTRIKITGERAIAECKAYSSRLSIQTVSSFYGKLNAERFGDPGVHGWFVAIPGLTSDAQGFADQIAKNDRAFRSLNATQVYDYIVQHCWVRQIEHDGYLSDHGILIAPSGMYAIAKRLDPQSRLPIEVLMHRGSPASKVEVDLFRGTEYASGLPIVDLGTGLEATSAQKLEVTNLVSVIGSSADFEYQFPAAPQFFVGRDALVKEIDLLLGKPVVPAQLIVLNAQSGWGKSSLALKIAELAKSRNGSSIVFDVRTANGTQYVAASLQYAAARAEKDGVLELPDNASFGSLQSSVRTIESAKWKQPHRPVVIFYDQFENIFRDERITQEFRDLALLIRELNVPLTIGFSWKTDFVALTENYPYRLRDEIRGAAHVFNVDPFGPKDVGVVLNRLAKEAGTPVSNDLRQRIREYSQGLPWLLKKLASHILKELRAGTTGDALLEESLNIEGLFQQDLAPLQSAETDALRLVAREAPVAVADIVERVEASVIQSLVDQRLLVRVGEKLDVYWDTFREFLVTGKLAVEDTFILRQRPRSTSKVLAAVIDANGELSTLDAAAKLSTSMNVVLNAARELRQLGILTAKPGTLALVDAIRTTKVTDGLLQARVAKALRRHRVFNTVLELIESSPTGKVTIDDLALALPLAYPAVAAGGKTWGIYAVAFANWLEYGGLITLTGVTMARSNGGASKVRLTGPSLRKGRMKTFPQTRPRLVLDVLTNITQNIDDPSIPASSYGKAINDLTVLGILDESGFLVDKDVALLLDDATRPSHLKDLLSRVPGGASAMSAIGAALDVDSMTIGGIIRDAYGLNWADSTTKLAGAKFRAWASEAGYLITELS